MDDNRPVPVGDFGNESDYRKVMELGEEPHVSGIAVPVGRDEAIIGSLCVYLDHPHEFTDDEINYLQSVSNLVSIVVERNRDRSRLDRLSSVMARNARINLLGELGTYIAHEVNQPLTALMNYLQGSRRILARHFGEIPEPVDAVMEKALVEAERAASIIQHMRDYLTTGEIVKSDEDINRVIHETIEVMRTELNDKHIQLEVSLQPDMPQVSMDKLQIQQVRPIRPEDAAIEKSFVNRLSARSRYFRFMQELKELTQEMLVRFSQLDYHRELALIAILHNATEREVELGVTRYIMNPDGTSCEFALVVADEWQGKGIGTRLMKNLIEAATQRGFREMNGEVISENTTMLRLVKSLGFSVSTSPDDPGIRLVSRPL